MTLRDRSPFELLARTFQALLAGVTAYGGLVGQWDLLINGGLGLAVTFVPAVLTWRYDHDTDPRLRLWIAFAALVHGLGVLGPYSAQSGVWKWYDQVAHAISGALVAGVGYALIAALDRHSRWLQFPDAFRFGFTLCFIVAVGVAWEIMEFAAGSTVTTFGGKEALVQYGIGDIVQDILFNTLAAVLVALWGTDYFAGLAALFTRRLPGDRDS